MSVFIFFIDQPNDYLTQMANTRAFLFFHMTKFAASAYGVNAERIITEFDGRYWIEPQLFCSLVEKVYDKPIDLLYVWASYAAGIYEDHKQEKYDWIWRGGTVGVPYTPREVPMEVKRTMRPHDYPHSGRVIGQYQIQQPQG